MALQYNALTEFSFTKTGFCLTKFHTSTQVHITIYKLNIKLIHFNFIKCFLGASAGTSTVLSEYKAVFTPNQALQRKHQSSLSFK